MRQSELVISPVRGDEEVEKQAPVSSTSAPLKRVLKLTHSDPENPATPLPRRFQVFEKDWRKVAQAVLSKSGHKSVVVGTTFNAVRDAIRASPIAARGDSDGPLLVFLHPRELGDNQVRPSTTVPEVPEEVHSCMFYVC
jgi:hypothetical protein